MVSKLFKLAAVPAGLAFTSYGLYAVADREPKGERLSPGQLSVYAVPLQISKYVEEQPGRLQSGFSVARQTVWPYVIWSKHVFSSIKIGVQDTIEFGKDSYVYLKNPPPEFLSRVGVIAVSGLAGLVLARKGSRLKKIVYPVGLTALGVSVCYPTQAVIFAKLTGKKIYATSHRTYDTVSSLWKTSSKKEEKTQTQEDGEKVLGQVTEVGNEDLHHHIEHEIIDTKSQPESPVLQESESKSHLNGKDENVGNNEALFLALTSTTKFILDPNLVDHGQSSPEDKDLYSTRS
ncbi:MICOS complex subunit MIC27 isoform X2 [Pelobates fuscus]|uniref:MICOS complex subunit MIC27 isoform X2 n=1 Tax=Pelobates fuscus TaxID=191477 RepID=UPI002FE4E774